MAARGKPQHHHRGKKFFDLTTATILATHRSAGPCHPPGATTLNNVFGLPIVGANLQT